MNKLIKIVAVVLSILMMFLTLGGCGKNAKTEGSSTSDDGFKSLYGDRTSEERLVFKKRNIEGDANLQIFWFQSTARDDVKDAAEMYKDLYGGDVEFYFSSWNDRATDLALLNTANKMPDVLLGFLEYDFPKFIDMGLFGELSESDFDFKNKYIDSASVDSILTVDGKKYGVAVKDDPEVILYNNEYFKELGYDTPWQMYKDGKWDWANFKTLSKNLSYDSDKDGVNDHYGFSAWSLKSLFVANNTWPLLVKNNKPVLNIDATPMKETFQMVYDMINVDKSMPAEVYGGSDEFAKGNVAMCIERPYVISSFIKSGMEAENIGIAPIPKGTSASEHMSFYSPNMSAISTSCKNKEAALAFIECYISVQKAMSENGPREVYGYTFTEQQQEAMDVLRNLKSVEIVPTGYGNFNSLVTGVYQQLVDGKTVSAALELNKNKMQNELNLK